MIFKLFFRTESFTSFTSSQGYNNYTIKNTIKNTNYNCLFFYTPSNSKAAAAAAASASASCWSTSASANSTIFVDFNAGKSVG